MKPGPCRFPIAVIFMLSTETALSGQLTITDRVNLAFSAISCPAHSIVAHRRDASSSTTLSGYSARSDIVADGDAAGSEERNLPRSRPPRGFAGNSAAWRRAPARDFDGCNSVSDAAQKYIHDIDLENESDLNRFFQMNAISVTRLTGGTAQPGRTSIGEREVIDELYGDWLLTGGIAWRPAREPAMTADIAVGNW